MSHYVLIDFEWIAMEQNYCTPTQLAAIRTDSEWNAVNRFSTLFYPARQSILERGHIAITCCKKADFISAPCSEKALYDFEQFLTNDDILCWWNESSYTIFNALIERILKHTLPQKNVFIDKYIKSFLSNKTKAVNPYKIAYQQHINVPRPAHFSPNDTETMRLVLATVGFPQKLLEIEPLEQPELQTPPKLNTNALSFIYDNDTGLLHKNDCAFLPSKTNLKGYSSLARCIKLRLTPCPHCLKKEYISTQTAICRDIINHSEYNFIYLPSSSVFHTYRCKLIRTSTIIYGCRNYEKALSTGRTPCKVCHPNINSERKPFTPCLKKAKPAPLPVSHSKAEKRLAQAQKERSRTNISALSEQQRKDIMTFTQPGYAFWSAKGYSTFHSRYCPKLVGLAQIKGFARYTDAVKAGYKPCRKCSPSPRQDAEVSFPIYSQMRPDETPFDIDALCDKQGYQHIIENRYYCISTPAGKWKINLSINPLTLLHLNLFKNNGKNEYHTQPRVFLSVHDAFFYIDRHDKNLLEQQGVRNNA